MATRLTDGFTAAAGASLAGASFAGAAGALVGALAAGSALSAGFAGDAAGEPQATASAIPSKRAGVAATFIAQCRVNIVVLRATKLGRFRDHVRAARLQ